MTKKLEIQFSCPDCGDKIPRGAESCPGCGLEIEWDEDESSDEVVDSLLNEISHDDAHEEGEVGPDKRTEGIDTFAEEEVGAAEGKPDEPPAEEGEEAIPVKGIEASGVSESPDEDSGEEESEGEEDEDTEGEETEEETAHPVIPTEGRGKRKLYASTFSLVGVLFVSLTVLFIIGIMVLYNWDTWIRGVEEASRGEQQTTAIYAAVLLSVVSAAIALLDARRNKRGHGARH